MAAFWAWLTANGCRILWRLGVAIALVVLFYAVILKPFLKPNPTIANKAEVIYSNNFNNKNYALISLWGGDKTSQTPNKPAALKPAK